MSPELFANKPYNFKSDVWALGCCVYEIATLKRAFSARNISALMYKILKGQVCEKEIAIKSVNWFISLGSSTSSLFFKGTE